LIRLIPPTVDHAPEVKEAPVAEELVVKLAVGKLTCIKEVAPTGLT
jgi:hypothetical protein